MIVGLALAETAGVYGFVLALLILFANPLVGMF
jgi:F-type H+-transporting ATPase subunit c